MSDVTAILLIIVYIFAIVFGTHSLRTVAFNRHEAITYESSSLCFLLGILAIWQYGFSIPLFLFCLILLIMFIANAFTQWHFYMVLQKIIDNAFSQREEYLENHGGDVTATNSLQTMASVAIMPSFSRWIEESKLFNNPGGFIGLIKSILRRQRFQKKKYLMREAFAENVNLIGPCKPEIDSMMLDEEHLIPGAIHANDLALGYSDEKKGLFSYDILGFGAHIAMTWYLISQYLNKAQPIMHQLPFIVTFILMILSAVAYVYISHILRHYGFARYESISYEFSVAALVIASFRVFANVLQRTQVPWYQWVILGVLFLAFLILSLRNKKMDKGLHNSINKRFDEILYKVSLETETDRIKRRFLTNLKLISEWTIVPYPENKRWAGFFHRLAVTDSFRKFEEINREKQDMPNVMEELIDRIVPEYKKEVVEEDFMYSQDILKKRKIVDAVISYGTFILLFVLIALGLI